MASLFIRPLLFASIIMLIDGCAVSGPSPLIVSIRSGDIAAVETLIEEGADVNAMSQDWIRNRHWKLTPLVRASISGNLEIMRLLIEAGADVNGLDEWGDTPLMATVEFRHIEAATLLLENGADIDITKPTGTTALMIAARNGDLMSTEILLRKGADPNIGLGSGDTALSLAAWKNDEDIVRELIEHGAISSRFALGRTRADINTVIRALLKLNLPVRYLCNEATIPASDTFESNPLVVSIRSNDIASVKSFIDSGENVNTHSQYLIRGQYWTLTPLVLASLSGNLDIMRLLIEAGANVDQQDGYGQTPLMATVECKHLEATNLLIKHGADVNEKNPVKKTALMVAARHGDRESAKFILSKGADPNIGFGSGYTALSVAAWFGYEDIVRELIEHGAMADHVAIASMRERITNQIRALLMLSMSVKMVCNEAITFSASGRYVWNDSHRPSYAKEAKRRGFTSVQCAFFSGRTASPEADSKEFTSSQDLAEKTDEEICRFALTPAGEWEVKHPFNLYATEARRRWYTTEKCAELLQ
jgi:ankyrin repeat protein